MTSDRDVPDILVSPSRRMAREYPWFDGVLGSCVALRKSRLASALLIVPALILDIIKLPGTGRIVRWISPLGQLAYGRGRAGLGFPYSTLGAECVDVRWSETVRSARIVSRGLLFARMEINERVVFVDKRCASPLVELWSV